MKSEMKQLLAGVGEALAVAFVSAAMGFLVYTQVVSSDDPLRAIKENSPIEILQVAFLVVSAALAAACAARRKDEAGGYVLVSGLFVCMAVRECDAILDHVFHGAWLPAALAAAIASVAVAAAKRGTVVPGLAAIVGDRRFGILATSLAIAFFYSRIFGMKRIWLHTYECIIGPEGADKLIRPIKNIAEEGLEALSYALTTHWAALSAFAPARRRQETL